MIRYIIRPKTFRKSPSRLAEALNVETRKWPNRQSILPNYQKDFLIGLPNPGETLHAPDNYELTYSFFHRNKLQQRKMLKASGVPIPWTYGVSQEEAPGTKYVIRPLRHMGGHDYQLVETVGSVDIYANPALGKYVSAIFPKKREYRVVFVYGEPLIYLRKKVPEGLSMEQPWNHDNGSSFKTIQNPSECKLHSKCDIDIVALLRNSPVVRGSHLVGADIMWDGQTAVVAELNSAPALEIENNIQKVADFIREKTV